MIRSFLSLGLVAALVFGAGCSGAGPPGLGGSDRGSLVDSLQHERTALQDRLRALQDSLQFLKNIESGQYYRERRTLQDRLNRLTYEVQTLRDGGQTVAVLSADSLFEPATATLTPSGQEHLRAVVTQLQTTYPDRTIRVEGHADNVPLSEQLQEQFPSNWELSGARASAVVRHLIDQTDLDRTQFVAVAYGATRPLASNETADGRRRNRRVRVAVLPPPQDYARPFETVW